MNGNRNRKKTIAGVVLLGLLLVLCQSSQQSQTTNFEFEPISFEEVLLKASAEDKPIFVEVMANWCGQCRRLEKDVLTDAEIDSVYHQDFICLQVNGEDQKDGKLCSIRYKVRAYPTLLYLDTKGKLLGKYEGVRNKSQLLNYREIHQ